MLRERKSNFECMRIIAMLMIIGHHLAIHGVQHALEKNVAYSIWADGSLLNKAFVCLLLPGGQIGVALFFMITGYFYIEKGKNDFSRIILEPLFYGIAMSLVYAVLLLSGRGISLSASSLISSIFNPASGGCWWFVTAYFFLMLISPLLNDFLKRLNRKGMLILIVLFWGLWYTIPYMASNTYIAMHRAVFFYILGACCRCFKSERAVNRTVYWGGASIGWLVGSLCFYIVSWCGSKGTNERKLMESVFFSIVVPLCAICFFSFFEYLDIGCQKWINRIASTTFGIYLIHDSPIGRKLIWHTILQVDTALYVSPFFPLYAVLCILGVFAVCAVIDMGRQRWVAPWMTKWFQRLVSGLKQRMGISIE